MATSGVQPLAGIRVLDLSRGIPGGYCGVLLADLGAEIVKVEPPRRGEAPLPPSGSGSPTQIGLTRGTRSITLDLRSEAGFDVLRRLVPTADVLLENARPGSMEERGFGFAHAAALHPRLVWASISGYGADGPYADRPGHDVSFLGYSGLLAALSAAQPWSPDTMLAVPLGALMAAFGITSALVGRARTGRGCFVDAAMSDAATWVLSGMPERLSAESRGMGTTAGRRPYRCADGRWVTTAAAEPRTWRALCDVLGTTDLADSLVVGVEVQAAIEARFESIFVSRTRAEWLDITGDSTIAPLHDGPDLADDPHARARGAVVEVEGVRVPAAPVRFRTIDGSTSTTPLIGPPQPGGDTDDVLSTAGFAVDEIAALRVAGTI